MNKKQDLGNFSGKSILSNKELNKRNIPHKDGWVTGSLVRGVQSYYICSDIDISHGAGLNTWWAEVDKHSVKREGEIKNVEDDNRSDSEQLDITEKKLKNIDNKKTSLIQSSSVVIDKEDYKWLTGMVDEYISFKEEYVKHNGRDKHSLIKNLIKSEKDNKKLQAKLEDKYYEISRIEDEIFSFIATNCEKIYEKWGNKPYTDSDYDLSVLLSETFDELEVNLVELREMKEGWETENSQIKTIYQDKIDNLNGLLEHFITTLEGLKND